MGLLDRLFGRRQQAHAYPAPHTAPPPSGQVPAGPGGTSEDERAIERYRYLLRTAPPDQVEEAHAEAFARLTPEQRQQVLGQLASTGERPQGDDPRSLARAATRAEVRSPGTLERVFGGGGYGPGRGYGGGYGGPGFGSIVGGSLLGTIGGLVVGTAVADALFDTGMGDSGLFGGGYGGGYGGPGFGSIVGGSLLGTIGGLVVGTAVADALFDTGMGDSGLFGGEDEVAAADGGDGFGPEDAGYGADGDYGDYGGGDFGGGDFGGGGDF